MHVNTWQVLLLIALDWDDKLAIYHVCFGVGLAALPILVVLLPFLKDQEADLSDYHGEEFDEVRNHTRKDNGYQNVPSLISVVIVSEEVGQVQQRVEVEGDHDLVED
jgi:hypothetical protein